MSRPSCLAIALWITVSACDDSPRDPSDAGVPDGAADASTDDAGPFEPLPPEPPASPVLTPCPPGWRETEDPSAPGVPVCDPWPAGGQAECPRGEAHLPGTAGCETVGTPCDPEDDWATDLPDGAEIVYAQAGRVGGNGLRSNPYGDLQQAIDVAAGRGAIVALSKGTFQGIFRLFEDVTLWGACTAETVIENEAVREAGRVLEVAIAGEVVVRNLSVSSTRHVGIDVYDLAGSLVLDSVIVTGAVFGVLVERSTVEATNLVVLGTAPSDTGEAGIGVAVFEDSRFALDRGVFARNSDTALTAYGEGAVVDVRSVAFLDTLPEAVSGLAGSGVAARAGARVTIAASVVQGGQSAGVISADPDSVIEAADLVVSDVAAAVLGGGNGVASTNGGRVVVRRLWTTGCHGAGLSVTTDGSSGEIEDAVVTDTAAAGDFPELRDGVGVGVGLGGSLVARRVLSARSTEGGVLVSAPDTRLEAEDLTVLDTSEGDTPYGPALIVDEGATAVVHRLHAAGSRGGAVAVYGSLELTDALVEDTSSVGLVQFDGWGVIASGQLDLERAIVRDHLGSGVLSAYEGRIMGRDVVVQRIGPSSGVATGLFAGIGGAIELSRFRVAGAESCGIQIGEGSVMDLSEGEVTGNPIGANVQDPTFDLQRIQNGVRYVDNGINLDTSRLPVPDLDGSR